MFSRQSSKEILTRSKMDNKFDLKNASSQRNIPVWAVESYARQKKSFLLLIHQDFKKINLQIKE